MLIIMYYKYKEVNKVYSQNVYTLGIITIKECSVNNCILTSQSVFRPVIINIIIV